jgi:hypothetical protein
VGKKCLAIIVILDIVGLGSRFASPWMRFHNRLIARTAFSAVLAALTILFDDWRRMRRLLMVSGEKFSGYCNSAQIDEAIGMGDRQIFKTK